MKLPRPARCFGGAVVVVTMLAGAACGQKPGVRAGNAVRAAVPSETSLELRGETPAPEPDRALTRNSLGPVTAGASTVSSSPPRDRTESPGATDPYPVAASGPRQPRLGESARPARPVAVDRTGVSATEIVIGMHAPLSGFLPITVADDSKYFHLYWKWLRDRGGIFGRNVRAIIRDDQYNPTKALQVCRELVERDHVFLLMGFGVDQIAPCARYAADHDVPYLSLGGPETGYDQLETYFTLSMSYAAQSPMLIQLIKRTSKTRLGIVVENTPNHNDAYDSITATARAAGLRIVRSSRLAKNADQGQALAEAGALRQAGAEVVYVLVSPVVFLNLAHGAQGQAYNPLWIGPGATSGLDLVAEVGCPSIGAAKFLSPWPGLDVIDRYDPEYRPAYRKYNNGEEPDDFGLGGWGLQKSVHRLLEAPGPDLSRQRFLAALESGREFASGVFPALRYGPGRHFGASQAHLLEANCNERRFRTLAAFVSAP
jgi:branched-chain amino acid transport system substrate-binding protein